MRVLTTVTVGLVVATAFSGTASADDGFANELFEPVPVQGRSLLGIGTSHSLLQGELSVGLFLHFEDDPLTLVDRDDRGEVLQRLIDERVTLEVLAAVGILDWLELGVALPLTLAQSGEDLGALGRAGETVGGASLGDLRVIPKVTLLGGAEGVGLHLSIVLGLPTGDSAELNGDGAVRIRPVLGVDYAADGFRVALEAGYEIRSERQAASYVSDDMVRWGLGGRVPFVRDLLGAVITLGGTVQTASGVDPLDPSKSLEDDPTISLETIGGLELEPVDGLMINAGAGFSLVHAVGSPDLRLYFGIGWTSPGVPVSDEDGDGLIADDKCPDDAEDVDGWRDEDGCPDLDNDRDGVPDTADKCRDDREDVDGVDDADGCPDVDDDADGVADDKCPAEAEDKDGFKDEDGCINPDDDGDGVADVSDKCKGDLEDKDGWEDDDGCKDPDNDGDGVADGADKCPGRREVKNGIADDDGCPDTAEKDVAITETDLKLQGKINFPRDSDRISADSHALLDTIAKVMNEHTYLTKVRVEGHTDSEGELEVNLELSKRRAAAVVAYLLTKGVAPERLTSTGYGESRPLMKNVTPAGRAQNRRIEIKLIEVDGQALPEPPPPPPP